MEFKDIPNYEGLYAASQCGCVMSRKRTKRIGGTKRAEHFIDLPDRVMSQSKSQNGYMVVTLSKNGKRQQLAVHRLVALTWLQKEDSGRNQVNHKNGVKIDNRVSNLEWCSSYENLLHAVQTGLRRDSKGEGNPKAKLTAAQVADIRHRQGGYGLIASLSKEFEVGRLCISRIRRSITWRT